jgi:hypothetical protein
MKKDRFTVMVNREDHRHVHAENLTRDGAIKLASVLATAPYVQSTEVIDSGKKLTVAGFLGPDWEAGVAITLGGEYAFGVK